MVKMASKKELHRNLAKITNDVAQNGVTYTIIQGSKVAFKIVPPDDMQPKYSKKDLAKFMFHAKDKKMTNLATTFKKYIY